MSMVFHFTVLSDENDDFVREYEVAYDMKLSELHKFICSDLKYDSGQMASFFRSDREWNKLQEYTLLDMGGEAQSMDEATLGNLIHRNHDRLIYTFDFLNDRSLYMELTATLTGEPGVEYPRCVASAGDAPGQFEALAPAGPSIFDEAMAEFGGFEGDDSYDDDF